MNIDLIRQELIEFKKIIAEGKLNKSEETEINAFKEKHLKTFLLQILFRVILYLFLMILHQRLMVVVI